MLRCCALHLPMSRQSRAVLLTMVMKTDSTRKQVASGSVRLPRQLLIARDPKWAAALPALERIPPPNLDE